MEQKKSDTCSWIIREVREEAPLVKSLLLTATYERPTFISGQYLTVRLPGFLPVEGKSYSISSSAEEEFVRLTVKEMGAFSKELSALHVGDTLITSLPYGFFYPEENSMNNLVFVAGGIGITPCMSMIETLSKKGYSKDVSLFYSNRTVDDITFNERLTKLETSFQKLRVTHHITRQDVCDASYKRGRMTGASIVDSLSNDPATNDYFICGSIDFTKNLWKELRGAGVPSRKIYTEGFH